MMARQASPTRPTTACIFLPLLVDDSSSAVMYPLTYCSYGGARETNHGCSAVHFYRRGKPAAFFHNARDTCRKATLTRPKPCRTAIQIGDNTRGMVEFGHRGVRHLSANKTLLPGSLWRPRRHGEIQ